MIVEIIYVERITVSERKITRQLARTVTAQKPFISPLRGCSRKPGIHVGDGSRRIQTNENIAEPVGVLARNAAMVVVFVKAFEAFVADRPDHILA